MLQRLGIVMATPGLIPACLAKGDSSTAQRHLGAALISPPTFEQHAGGTAALAFRAALKHGLRLAAAALIGVFPQALPPPPPRRPAASTLIIMLALERNRMESMAAAATQFALPAAMINVYVSKQLI
ncbi:unnamed protein product [Linum tenue]|uniref:Uncharacterized protein n=1 Tax=Linum tenue TaxID=586396 RepID=A0AAV0NIJ4_9ROSI|nr:unnamed protein product [Linum tenue]